MDTFDLKPNAPKEFRGEFNPIETNVPGIEICEHLPKLAKCADKFAILRGVSHSLAAHEFGTKYMNTGNRPIPSLEFPGYGVGRDQGAGRAAATCRRSSRSRTRRRSPGYLGVEYAPFSTTNAPAAGQPFTVRGITLGRGLTVEEIEKRRNLLNEPRHDLPRVREGQRPGQRPRQVLAAGLRHHQLAALAQGVRHQPGVARDHQALQREPVRARAACWRPGWSSAGVRFVSVSSGGWDTHQQNFEKLKTKLLARPRQRPLRPLHRARREGTARDDRRLRHRRVRPHPEDQRNGRPRPLPPRHVRPAGRRRHEGGQVIGASDEKAMGPASGDGITPDDVAASFYHALGIDSGQGIPHHHRPADRHRPLRHADQGTVRLKATDDPFG